MVEISVSQPSFSILMVLAMVTIVGSTAVVTIGSIAWYNSKKSLGWKDEERYDYVPKVDK